MRVLVVNAGSSSLKHALVETPGERIVASGEERWEPGDAPGRHATALRAAVRDAAAGADAIGHRVVHGGDRFTGPTRIDAAVREAIADLAGLAPLHNRAALEGIDAAAEALPGLPQVACFDTAFHRTLPPAAATYALPPEWRRLRRYGFHGLNVQWCAERAVARRLVVCHLGSGSSVTAVLDGRSVDTTMGLTPLEGVPMATRSGSVDPGLLLRLLRDGVTVEELDDALNHRSGLLGLAGTPDLRAVLAAARAGDARAALARDVLVRGVAAAVGAMTTALDGLDCLVFTAGVGEHSAELRAAVASRLAHLGVRLDAARNATCAPDAAIQAEGAPVRVLVIAAGEERIIARQTVAAPSRIG